MEFMFEPVDDLTKVPAEFKPLYATEPGEDGKYNVVDTYKGAATAIVGLNKSLKAARQDAKNAKVDLSPLNEFGADPASIRAAIDTKLTELQNQLASGKDAAANLESIRTEFKTNLQKVKDEAEQRVSAVTSQLYDVLVVNEAITELSSAGFTPLANELLTPIIRNKTKMINEDGKHRVYIVNDTGERRFSVGGDPMSIKELVAELKTDPRYAPLIKSDQTAAGNKTQPGTGTKTATKTNQAPANAVDRIAAGLAKRSTRR